MSETPKTTCPECVEGVVTETLRYSQPPLGVTRWQSPDWLRVPGRESRTYEVEASRPCIRCGGRGEL